MRAQIKVVLLVAVLLIATVTAVLMKTRSLLNEDKVNFVNDSAMKQLAPLKRLVSEKLDTEKNDLVRFATAREAQGPGHATSFAGFDAIALVEPNAVNGQWLPTWIEKGPGLRAERWTEGYDLTLLKSLPYLRVKDGSTLWVRLSDAQGAPLYAVMDSVEVQAPAVARPAPMAPVSGSLPEVPAANAPVATIPGAARRAVIVGFASENPLAAVTEDYIGSSESVYLVDDRGYVASHVRNSYLGNSFAEDKITQEIIKTPKVSDTRETTDMDGHKVIAHFERIDRSNLAAVIATPTTVTTGLTQSYTQTVLLVGGLMGLLSLIVAYLFGGTLQSSTPLAARASSYMPDASSDLASLAPEASLVQTRHLPTEVPREELEAENAGLQDDRLRTERKNAFEAFNAGLAARLREPLLAILGHAQLAKTKSTDADLVAHAESIEREARLAKEAIERFQIIEESASLGPVNETCDLEKVVLSALAEKAIEIEGSGIMLEKNLMHVPRVKGRAADLESMIVHILENSIEALRDRPVKKITVHIGWIKDHVRLLISDSGVGMTRDVRDHAFEPFFKGFAAPRHMGLGLAFVQTTMKRIGASYELESSPGEGTVFTIEFPVDADARREFEATTAAPGLDQINERIDAFTLGGRKPIVGGMAAPTPPPPVGEPIDVPSAATSLPRATPPMFEASKPGTVNEFTISSITRPGMDLSSMSPEAPPPEAHGDGFRVQIRRPKPRGN